MPLNTITVTGKLARLEMYGRWGRGAVDGADGSRTVVTGEALEGLELRQAYVFTGRIKHHAKFGAQLEVVSVQVHIPISREALLKHLVRNYANVGSKTANKLIDHYEAKGELATLRDQIVRNPFGVDFSPVSTNQKIKVLNTGDMQQMIYREFSTRLAQTPEVRDSILRKLAAYFMPKAPVQEAAQEETDRVTQAWKDLAQNPYAPIRDLDGYAFGSADAIGQVLSVPRNNRNRVAALATFVLDEGCGQGGHAFLTYDEIAEKISRFDPEVDAEGAISAAIATGEPIVCEVPIDETQPHRYYLASLRHAEIGLARFLAKRLKPGEPLLDMAPEAIDREIRQAELDKGASFRLDDSQRQAVRGILSSRLTVHTVTAGPGCGKTAIMEIVTAIVHKHRKMLFCAPTGKAAKVLTSRIAPLGHAASTIHTLLEVGVDDSGTMQFARNSTNPLDAQVVVGDETSMDDLQLTHSLMGALPPDAHIILLGDTQQLPSVGPGNVLADLMAMPFDHHRLTKTHRNDGGILEVVRLAGQGRMDMTNRPDVTFTPSLPPADDVSVTAVLARYTEAVAQCGGDLAKVGFLVARRKGKADVPGWNVTYLNAQLREQFNPQGQKIRGTQFHVGDRIIIRKNLLLEQGKDPEGKPVFASVVNGDTGFISAVVMDDHDRNAIKHIRIELDDRRDIRMAGEHMEKLGHAYAMSVHAAQGSEYRHVVFICVNGSPSFVHRGIVFTAFSRAKEHLSVIAEPQALASILRRDTPRRNSALVERVLSMRTAA